MAHTVLIVDDEEYVRNSLVALIEGEDLDTATASGRQEAMKVLRSESVNVIVSDLRMPSGDGLELLSELHTLGLQVPVILLTGVGTIADAVAAMKAGAFDFIEKPVDPDQFLHLVRRAIEYHDLVAEVKYLRQAVSRLRMPVEIVGDSRALAEVRDLIRQVAGSDATVLVSGESGTGKELVAAELHRLSRRSEKHLVSVNCAAISESLFESEFFGHRRGAFTGALGDRQGRFAEAEGGTLVLDEIGTLDPSMQAKLLRVLETGEYQVVGESRTRVADVRVIAITNEDLPERVRTGAFRADLFFRLNVFPIAVPPLRDRKEDVAALASYFLRRCWLQSPAPGGATESATEELGEDALAVLMAYDWPGNVRELRNVMERAVILSRSQAPPAALFERILGSTPRSPSPGGEVEPDAGLELRPRLEAVERQLVTEALRQTGGKKGEAASLLGIDAKNISYYLRKHSIADDVGKDHETGGGP